MESKRSRGESSYINPLEGRDSDVAGRVHPYVRTPPATLICEWVILQAVHR